MPGEVEGERKRRSVEARRTSARHSLQPRRSACEPSPRSRASIASGSTDLNRRSSNQLSIQLPGTFHSRPSDGHRMSENAALKRAFNNEVRSVYAKERDKCPPRSAKAQLELIFKSVLQCSRMIATKSRIVQIFRDERQKVCKSGLLWMYDHDLDVLPQYLEELMNWKCRLFSLSRREGHLRLFYAADKETTEVAAFLHSVSDQSHAVLKDLRSVKMRAMELDAAAAVMRTVRTYCDECDAETRISLEIMPEDEHMHETPKKLFPFKMSWTPAEEELSCPKSPASPTSQRRCSSNSTNSFSSAKKKDSVTSTTSENADHIYYPSIDSVLYTSFGKQMSLVLGATSSKDRSFWMKYLRAAIKSLDGEQHSGASEDASDCSSLSAFSDMHSPLFSGSDMDTPLCSGDSVDLTGAAAFDGMLKELNLESSPCPSRINSNLELVLDYDKLLVEVASSLGLTPAELEANFSKTLAKHDKKILGSSARLPAVLAQSLADVFSKNNTASPEAVTALAERSAGSGASHHNESASPVSKSPSGRRRSEQLLQLLSMFSERSGGPALTSLLSPSAESDINLFDDDNANKDALFATEFGSVRQQLWESEGLCGIDFSKFKKKRPSAELEDESNALVENAENSVIEDVENDLRDGAEPAQEGDGNAAAATGEESCGDQDESNALVENAENTVRESADPPQEGNGNAAAGTGEESSGDQDQKCGGESADEAAGKAQAAGSAAAPPEAEEALEAAESAPGGAETTDIERDAAANAAAIDVADGTAESTAKDLSCASSDTQAWCLFLLCTYLELATGKAFFLWRDLIVRRKAGLAIETDDDETSAPEELVADSEGAAPVQEEASEVIADDQESGNERFKEQPGNLQDVPAGNDSPFGDHSDDADRGTAEDDPAADNENSNSDPLQTQVLFEISEADECFQEGDADTSEQPRREADGEEEVNSERGADGAEEVNSESSFDSESTASSLSYDVNEAEFVRRATVAVASHRQLEPDAEEVEEKIEQADDVVFHGVASTSTDPSGRDILLRGVLHQTKQPELDPAAVRAEYLWHKTRGKSNTMTRRVREQDSDRQLARVLNHVAPAVPEPPPSWPVLESNSSRGKTRMVNKLYNALHHQRGLERGRVSVESVCLSQQLRRPADFSEPNLARRQLHDSWQPLDIGLSAPSKLPPLPMSSPRSEVTGAVFRQAVDETVATQRSPPLCGVSARHKFLESKPGWQAWRTHRSSAFDSQQAASS